jgi:predicted amidohydrolase
MLPKLRAAACHVSPIFLNAQATTDKCISLIHRASRAKANLVVFPETYIPAFPVWSALLAPTETHDFFHRMVQESIHADGEHVNAIRKAAKDTGTVVSLGFSEKARYSTATLFNSNLIIGSDGEVLVHHRKLMPTFFEKLTWAPGDGHGLRVADTPSGKIGALICGENTNPLARYALMAMGEKVHISTWPAIWPTRQTTSPAPDKKTESQQRKQGVNYDNITANRTRVAAHSFEAKCFGISCAAHFSPLVRHALLALIENPNDSLTSTLNNPSQAPTFFVNPTGAPHPAFTIDNETGESKAMEMLQGEEGILYADMDLEECVEGKQYHDVVGGYQRLDVFELRVDRARREPAFFIEDVR